MRSRPTHALGVSSFCQIKFTNLKIIQFWVSTAKFFHRQYFVIYGIKEFIKKISSRNQKGVGMDE